MAADVCGSLRASDENSSATVRDDLRIFRRDESREDRSGLMARNDRGDRRQNSRHPGRRPETAGSEDVLHVDAQVNGVADVGNFRRAVSHRSPPSGTWPRAGAGISAASSPSAMRFRRPSFPGHPRRRKCLPTQTNREKPGVGGIGLRRFPTKRNFQLYVAHSKASIGFGQAGDSNGGMSHGTFPVTISRIAVAASCVPAWCRRRPR